MEDHLQKATEQFEARVNEQKKTLTPEQFNEFERDHVEEYVYYDDEFPYILRNSFFVSAYFLLEYDIKKICKVLKDRKQIPINLSNLKGNLLDRLKLYFKLAGLDFSNKIWPEITNYAKVRNCIVHNRGLVKGSRQEQELRAYITQKNIISKELIREQIALTEQFCRDITKTIWKFLSRVLEAYESQRQKQKSDN